MYSANSLTMLVLKGLDTWQSNTLTVLFQDGLLVRETIMSGDILYRKRLLGLNHPNLAVNLTMGKSDTPFRIIEMVSSTVK